MFRRPIVAAFAASALVASIAPPTAAWSEAGRSAVRVDAEVEAEGGSEAETGLWLFALTTSNRLARFSAADSCDVELTKITGLADGEVLIGIDVRPANGTLYAVGRVGSLARLYTIDTDTGVASFVAMLRRTSDGQPIELVGSEFGFDFNPAADALRIVSDAGQNLRALPSDRIVAGVQRFTGDTFVDGSLSYSVIGASPRATAFGVSGAAYTNPDVDPATGTALFDIDSMRDDLVMQNPPNDGKLSTIGSLGLDAKALLGFDIAASGAGYATFKGANMGCGASWLAAIDLGTGQASYAGRIGLRTPLRGLAVDLADPSDPSAQARVRAKVTAEVTSAMADAVVDETGSTIDDLVHDGMRCTDPS